MLERRPRKELRHHVRDNVIENKGFVIEKQDRGGEYRLYMVYLLRKRVQKFLKSKVRDLFMIEALNPITSRDNITNQNKPPMPAGKPVNSVNSVNSDFCQYCNNKP